MGHFEYRSGFQATEPTPIPCGKDDRGHLVSTCSVQGQLLLGLTPAWVRSSLLWGEPATHLEQLPCCVWRWACSPSGAPGGLLGAVAAPIRFSPLLPLQVDQRVFRDLMSEKLPRLHTHFEQYRVDYTLITFNWFLVVFVDSVVSDILFKIWDSFLYEGPKVGLLAACLHGQWHWQQSGRLSWEARRVPRGRVIPAPGAAGGWSGVAGNCSHLLVYQKH